MKLNRVSHSLLMGLAMLFCADQVVAQDVAEFSPEINAIIEAGRTDNQVQDHLDYLTNRIGPRLTGSEGLQEACEWARERFENMGLTNCRLEKWGEFPVGFERGASHGRMVEPRALNLTFGTNAWTAGTKGRVVANAVLAPKTMEELEERREELSGKYILMERAARGRRRPRRQPATENTDDKKTDDEKSDKELSEEEIKKAQEREARRVAAEAQMKMRAEQRKVNEALVECNVAGLITATSDERILTGGRYNVDFDNLPTTPRISVLKKQFDEIKKELTDGESVKLAFEIRNHFRKGPIPLYNVIADIPGTEFPDEYVVIGGHIDSWDGATGATDNGAGVATTMEAARILMAAGIKPKRTIRFMLWSGEEQGLLGSRAYVKQNEEDVVKSVSAVFVHDGGTNYVSGLRCTKSMLPDFENVFAAAMQLDERTPFDLSTTDAIRPRGGSDHVSFIRVGVPGFFWGQSGRATYRTTHHTQYDTYDSVVPEYQRHSSMVIALGAFGVAELDHLLSREGVQKN